MPLSKARSEAENLAAVRAYTQRGVRSVSEARKYLEERGADEARVAGLISVLRQDGLLDDRACARLSAEHWARAGYGAAVIQAKLSAKGLDGSTIADALLRLNESESDEDRARGWLAAGRGRQTASAHTLAGQLLRRGFERALISRLLKLPEETELSE